MPRVLIVEDDPKIYEAVEKTLSMGAGFTLRWVSDPAKALGEVRSDGRSWQFDGTLEKSLIGTVNYGFSATRVNTK